MENSPSTTGKLTKGHVPGARGVIIRFKEGRGTIIICPKHCDNVRRFAEDFAESKVDEGYWFARFKWSEIESEDRDEIAKLQKASTANTVLLAEILVGREVDCDLVRSPKWEARCIAVDLVGDPYPIPRRHRRSRQPDPKNTAGLGKVARQLLDGNGKNGATVHKAVGGQKPGSHRS